MDDSPLLLELLQDVLGEINSHYPNKGQISFDCPVCSYDIKGLDTGDGKGNFEVNYSQGVYKCWACSEVYATHGSINKLFLKWGNKRHKSTWELIGGDFIKTKKQKYEDVKLPHHYISFTKGNKLTIPYKEAYNYLRKRNISDVMISKYSIGYTTEGPYRGRIIVPSFDKNEEINYFVSRYLVEGVFDMFFVPNSIPLLGKNVSDKLWGILYDNSKKHIVICLDGDAWKDSEKLYRKLDGGKLNGKIRLLKVPQDKDVGELGGIKGLEEIRLL